MFGQTSNTGFGGFNTSTQSSPFGQSAFGKPISTTSFGTGSTPVFGSNNTSLFSNKPAGTTPGNLFGNSTTTSAFGQPATTQSSFGAFGTPTANTGLFGTQQNTNTTLFGTNNTTSAFGQNNKSTGFSFMSTPGNTLFGQPQPTVQQTTPFGQPSTTQNTSLFGTSGAFRTGTTTTAGITGTVVKFVPVQGTDSMVKNGTTQNIATRHHCIMCMKEYENKSLEELRMEDYHAGLKGPSQTGQTSGIFNANSSLFSNPTSNATNTGSFGIMSNSFAVNNQANTTGNLFSKPVSGFGVPTTTTSAFAFNPTTSTSLFPSSTQQNKFGVPTQNNLFSNANTNQPAPSVFGVPNTQTSNFNSFTAPQQNQGIGLFNQKPAFNMAPATSNTGFSFGPTAPTSTSSNLFSKPVSSFGPTTGGFNSTPATGFNTNTFGPTNTSTSLFNTPFKPANQTSFFSPTPAASTALPTNTNLNLSGTNSIFGPAKPGGLFNNTSTGSVFNNPSGFSMNSMPGQSTNFMGSTLGTNPMQPNLNSVPVHQQILALVSTPFGDSPLLKNLLPASGKAEELIKPTNSATKISKGKQYKVSTTRDLPKIKRNVVTPGQMSRKSLFDGLEEEDPTLLEAFQPRSNTKRLVLRPKTQDKPVSAEENQTTTSNVAKETTVEDSLVASVCNNEVRNGDKENFQQNIRNLDGDRRSSSTSWLKSHLPRSTKVPEAAFDGQKSPFNSSDIREEELENTVADLLAHNKKNATPENTHKEKIGADYSITFDESAHDLDSSSYSVSAENTPNAAKINLNRSGYYTIPPLDQIDKFVRGETCIVPNFTVGRNGYGNVFFPDSFDVYGLDLDEIVYFRSREVIIYPDDSNKPPIGQGLNRRAQVTLDRVWPHDKNLHEPITDPNRLAVMKYEDKLRRVCAKHDTRFLEYRPETGSWVFNVDHFSKYGLSDSDDEDAELIPDGPKKLKMLEQSSKKSAVQSSTPMAKEMLQRRSRKMNQKTPQNWLKDKSMNGLNGQPMSTTKDEEDSEEDYDAPNDANNLKDFNGDKTSALSPTSIYARLTGTDSHKLQLMKASFFDTEADDMSDIYGESETSLKNYEFQVLENGSKSLYVPTLRSNISFHNDSSFSMSKDSFQPVKEMKTKKIQEIKPAESKKISKKFFPPPIVNPETRVLKFRSEMIPLKDSICYKLNFRCIADMSIQMGRKFKPCWGPGLTLISLSTQEQASVVPLENSFSTIATYISGRSAGDNTSTSIVQRLQLLGGSRADADYIQIFKKSIVDHLRVQLNHCVIGQDDICNWIRAGTGVTALHDHCALAQDIIEGSNADRLSLYSAEVWQLCVALWGNLPSLQADEKQTSHDHVMIRREAFGEWLKLAVEETVQSEIAEITAEDELLMSLLSANKLPEACEQARKVGDYTLALLMSQFEGASAIKELLKQTIALWQATDVLQNVSLARLKVYLLATGEPLIQYNDEIVNVCESFDWKRALAIHLWYLSVPTASITDVLELYEAAFMPDEGEVYATAPMPAYKVNDFVPETTSDKKVFDLCYHLIKLYSTGNHSLEELLNPMTHTADPLDYRLCWLLQQVIVGLGYSHLSDYVAALTHTNFAAQLEAHDLWHWAVFVVLHLNDPQTRRLAVTQLLERHVQINDDEDYLKRETFLKEELGIPIQWIYEAKAIRACAFKRYGEAAWYLLQAKQWDRAHEIIIQHLAAEALVNGNYDYLKSLLSPMVPPEVNSLVNGWSYQGQLLWDYMTTAAEVEAFVNNPDYSQIGYTLELLQPQLISLSTKVNQFPCPTAKLTLCQAEIAKRTLHLARSLLALQRSEDRPPAKLLVRLVSQLPLPEDYAQQELRPIVNMCVNEIFGY